MQPNRPLRRSERLLVGLAAALICGACAARLALDLGRLGFGGGLERASAVIGLLAMLVALPYAWARTLQTAHFAAVLVALTVVTALVAAII